MNVQQQTQTLNTKLQNTKAPFIATQLNSTQLPVVDPPTARRRGSERRDPVEVVCGS